MIVLRPGQIEVAQYKKGIMAVPAVPGAGKTTVLSHLAANLIAQDLQPGQKILVVTVMNSAVSNFKSKMRSLLEARGLSAKGYEVKTLHSLGLMILKERPERVMVNSAFDLITGEESERLINGLTDRWMARNRERWIRYIQVRPDNKFYEKGLDKWANAIRGMIRSTITHIKLQGFTRLEWEEIQNRAMAFGRDSFLKWSIEVMADYDWQLKHLGRVDFDDLIVLAYRLLQEDEALRERMQDKWVYIFEDEAQDSTPLQEKILKLLSAKSGNLLRVGDCNQGIMGFSGTDSSLFARFCEEAYNQPIYVASRSTEDIMEFANHFVSWTRSAFPLAECRGALEAQTIVGAPLDDPFPNPVVEGYGVSIHEFSGTLGDELKVIAGKAASAARLYPDKTIAILVRTNQSVEELVGHLTDAGAEWEDVANGPVTFQRSLEDIKTILAYMAEPYQTNKFWDVLQGLLADFDPEELEVLRGFISQYHPEEILYPIGGSLELSMLPVDLVASGSWTRVDGALADIRRWLEYSFLRPDELILQLAGELALETEQVELINTFAGQVSRFLSDYPGSDLTTVMKETNGLDKTMKYVVKNMRDRQGYTPRPGVISLSTMHRAKGLEWQIVYVAGLATDQIPENLKQKSLSEVWSVADAYRNPAALAKAQLDFFAVKSGNSLDQVADTAKFTEISESLRLIYVAITRAQERLVLSSHTKYFDKDVPPSSIFTEMKRFVREKHAAHHR